LPRGSWQTITIDRGDIGLRVDLALLRHLGRIPGVTRTRIQRLIGLGAVQINRRPAARASRRLAAGDELRIELPERTPRAAPAAELLPLDVLFEDEHLLVVNKPAGQVSHPAFRNTTGTLLNALLAYAGGAWTPALLSRLDKGTSGLVLVAKSPATQRALQRAGERNRLEKDYLAIVLGRPPAKGTIDLALDRDPWDRRRVTVRDRGGARSVTKFQRLRSVAIGEGRHLSLLTCRLVTGRTHQIRVHLSAKGWPIVGETVYQVAGARGPAFPRPALHAWRLAFPHPFNDTRIDVTAPIPADMRAVIDQFVNVPA
jgi:23S rRNA pseudouridine1911/1915/1917 synthase